VPGEKRKLLPAWPVLAALLVLCGLLPARVAADSSAPLRSRAAELQRQNSSLASRSHSALLELYGLDSQLARARAHIVALRIEAAQVRAEREATQQRLTVARRSLDAAQRALGLRVQQLYEQGDELWSCRFPAPGIAVPFRSARVIAVRLRRPSYRFPACPPTDLRHYRWQEDGCRHFAVA